MRLPTYLSRLLNCLNVHLPMDEGRRNAANQNKKRCPITGTPSGLANNETVCR